jgi:hypothetical protein
LVEGRAQYETLKGLENTIRSAAEEEALRKNTSKKKKDWYDAESELAIERRRRARRKFLEQSTEQCITETRETRRETRSICRRKKRQEVEGQMKEIGENSNQKQIRNFYQGIKKEKKEYQPKQIYCKNNEGQIIINEEENLEQ